jgi:carbon-monoxide dehydrogenase medium subunit
VIPAPFRYRRAASVAAAVHLLADDPGAVLLAGGQSLLPLLTSRARTPATLVDIGGLDALRYTGLDGATLVIGAATRHAELAAAAVVRAHAPLLARAAGLVGDAQIRARGTLGGSLAFGSPAADLPVAALALGARAVLTGPDGRRVAELADLAVARTEVLVELRVPVPVDPRWSYQRFSLRTPGWPVVAVAVVGCLSPRVALGAMGPRPLRAAAVERALAAGASGAAAAAAAAEGTDPPDDLAASAAYRRHLARVLTARALAEVGR